MNLSYNKKIIKTVACSILLASGASLIFCGLDLKNKNESAEPIKSVENYKEPKYDFSPKKEEKITQNEEMSDFIIKEYNGSVAVFESGKNLPFKTTETPVSDLPATDKELLKKGINVSGEEELSRILEDYCS